jgi:superoxide dismutase, Fe-Mn family
MDRRESLKAIALGGLAITSAGSWASEGKPSFKEISLSSDEIQPKPLTFNPKKLVGLSDKLINSHWENNYGGSVKALNGVNKKLKEALANRDTPTFIIGGLKREHLLRTGSVVNHDLYFGNLGGNGKLSGEIKSLISKAFSSVNSWEQEFKRIATSLAGGPGWVILGYNYHLKVMENYWSYDHMHFPSSTIPLLVMDMYEHSYQIDYGASAPKYIDTFFKNINWEVVNRRLDTIKAFS